MFFTPRAVRRAVDAGRAKWWGWGLESRTESLAAYPSLRAFLEREVGFREVDPLRVPSLDAIRLPPSRLAEGDVEGFRAIGDGEGVSTAPFDRLVHAFGKSYRDLLRLRLGHVPAAPDVVLFPESEAQIEQALGICTDRGVAVVPFGGGTGVVGGVEVSDPRPHATMDLRRMNRLLAVDAMSLTATAEAGILGPDFESALNGRGLTIGHFPQSFEFSTLGGWIATRSTGVFSNRYGKIEDLVVALRLVAPSRTLELRGRPRHAMGGDLLALAVGSEGTLGVFSRATVRVHRAPAARRFASVLFRTFGEGLDALRRMAQDGVAPDMAYLDDEDETRLSVAGAGGAKAGRATLLKARGVSLEWASLAFLAYEGSPEVVRSHLALGRRYCRGAVSIGPGPAERWFRRRFDAPYVRDALLEQRVMVDTLETAAVWSNVERVHAATKKAILDAIAATGVRGWVGCHVSHLYPEGASLYFTFLAPMARGAELAQYDAVKAAATRAILDHGGHLSHHHGIGLEHAKYYREAVGEAHWRLWQELKRALDPAGIMNPGKLVAVSA